MKIVTVIGARPQFVKASVVSRVFTLSSDVEEFILHTGQHFDSNMSDIFFEEMNIPKPHKNLYINGLQHGAMTGQMLEKIEQVLLDVKPDWVLVYGDTNSTIAGALAAKKLQIKVAHVEAGLRSCYLKNPEEINRILTDRLSDILFCPTDKAMHNLEMEGYNNLNIKMVKIGDVMQDAALYYSERPKRPAFDLPEKYILCTIHRAENTDDNSRFINIFKALEIISEELKIVLPLHPRTKGKLESVNFNFKTSKIHFTSPVGYLEMVYLLTNCEMVMTDSGGLQKEAYFFEKNCVTLRDETEWVELVENGYNVIAGGNTENILSCVSQMLQKKGNDYTTRLYGKGDAGHKVLEGLLNY